MEFNINGKVRVKLTDFGISLLKDQHESLKDSLPKIGDFKPPKTDDRGFSEWQLWELMSRFGSEISLGCEVPFHTVIEL